MCSFEEQESEDLPCCKSCQIPRIWKAVEAAGILEREDTGRINCLWRPCQSVEFVHLFSQDDSILHEWRRQNGLLATGFPCPVEYYSGKMDLHSLSCGHGWVVCRSSINVNHTRVSRMYSFFEKSNLHLQDSLLFIKSYLEKNSLAQCSRFSWFSPTTTAINWASYIRKIIKEHFYTNLRHRKLWGIVEISKSLFGCRVKFHRGNPNRRMNVTHFQVSIVLLLNFIFSPF